MFVKTGNMSTGLGHTVDRKILCYEMFMFKFRAKIFVVGTNPEHFLCCIDSEKAIASFPDLQIGVWYT